MTGHEDKANDDEATDAMAEGDVTSVAAVVVVGVCCGVSAGGGADAATPVATLTERCIEFGSETPSPASLCASTLAAK